MRKTIIFIRMALFGMAITSLTSCIFCKTRFYQVLPLSYKEVVLSDSKEMNITNLTMMYDGAVFMNVRFYSDSSFVLEKSQFALFNGPKAVTPYFSTSWVNDTLQESFQGKTTGMAKNNRKRIVIKKGYNDICLIASHLGKVFTQPLKLTFQPVGSSASKEIFALEPQDVILMHQCMREGVAVYSEKKLIGDSVRMMFLGELRPSELPVFSIVDGSDLQVLNKHSRYFMLTFDRLHGYDVNVKNVMVHAKDSAYKVSMIANGLEFLKLRTRKDFLKTREETEYNLPNIQFSITYKDNFPVTTIPALYVLPGEFITKNGIPIAMDTIEIYREKINHNN